MKKNRILYWIFTLLFTFLMAGSAIPDALVMPIAIKGMHQDLGYPLYLIPFVGVAKLLGVITVLIPGFPRLKEWAYAGLAFDLLGATYSVIAVGAPSASIAFMALPLFFGTLSYIWYRKMIVLPTVLFENK